ncbi:MAG: nitroreductase family protein [Coriobacteriia bacterium]|nr:nitroreductase family protein [Coriobacteriia bacterium]
MMQLFEALENRHSIRAYRSDPVPRELLDRLVYAASLAPSALNEQPWHFYITAGETRQNIGEIMLQGTHYLEEYMAVLGHEMNDHVLQWYSELGGAPVIIACTCPRTDDEFMRMNKHLSMGGATQSMLLAATELGLGACSLTFSFWVRDEIAQMIGVPDDRVIVGLIAVGYPAEEPESHPRNTDIATYLD